MSEQKTVFNRLFKKEELASHKVDLALVDDIDKKNKETLVALQNADKSWKEYQNYLSKADAPFKKMMAARESYLKSTTDVTGLLNKAVLASKELGLNPEDIKGYSALKKNIMTGNEVIDTIDTFKDPSSFQ